MSLLSIFDEDKRRGPGFEDTIPTRTDSGFEDTLPINPDFQETQPPHDNEMEINNTGKNTPSTFANPSYDSLEKRGGEKNNFIKRIVGGLNRLIKPKNKEDEYAFLKGDTSNGNNIRRNIEDIPKISDNIESIPDNIKTSIEVALSGIPNKKEGGVKDFSHIFDNLDKTNQNPTIPKQEKKETPSTEKKEEMGVMERLHKINLRLDEKLEKRGFHSFVKRMKDKTLEKISDIKESTSNTWEGAKNVSLEYKNLSISKRALIATGLIGISFATAGSAVPVALGMTMRILGGIGVYTEYMRKANDKRIKNGENISDPKDQAKAFMIAVITASVIPDAFKYLGESVSPLLEEVTSKIGEAYSKLKDYIHDFKEVKIESMETSVNKTPGADIKNETIIPSDTTKDVVANPSSVEKMDNQGVEVNAEKQETDIIDVPSHINTEIITINHGESLSTLLSNKTLFPELNNLNPYQRLNAINNIILFIEKDMSSFGLSENLWLKEGQSFDISKVKQIIENSKLIVGGKQMSIIERAQLL